MSLRDTYLESQVLSADPLELVRILYRAANEEIRLAVEDLAAGRVAERSRRISKAHGILTQLTVSLDHSRGGKLSRRLAELYDYMQRRLIEANLQQKKEPLLEVEGLLGTLLVGWEALRERAESADDNASSRRSQEKTVAFSGYPSNACFAPAPECVTQSWSF